MTRSQHPSTAHPWHGFLIALGTGLFFGWGLTLSGMTDPGKVLGFLDLAGLWDPSLAFVMGGAIAVGAVAFAVAKKRTHSFLGGAMHVPTARDVDKRLVLGSLLFGVGWGLAGFCPGPAIVSAAAGQPKALAFVAAMLAGSRLVGRDQEAEFGQREPKRHRTLQGAFAAERTALAGNDQHQPQARSHLWASRVAGGLYRRAGGG